MDASKLPKGKSQEVATDGRPLNQPGIYKHKDTGGIFITAEGEAGVLQADALTSPIWKDAWEWTAEVPSRTELLKMRKAQEIKDATEEALEKGKEAAELKAAKKAALEAAEAEIVAV
jgi:hypothetical protein